MAANLRFVTHPAQRLAHELAASGAGDRFAEAGLADTRRADEAQDRAFQLVGPRLNREIFDDPFLDLLKRIVVIVEHLLRIFDVAVELALFVPRQV